MLSYRTRIGLWTVSLITGLAGMINLFSAVTPSLPERVALLKPLIPFEVRVGGHLFTAITGFFLLTLAVHLLRRKWVAWWMAISVLIVSIFSNLIKGLDYEEGLLSLVLLGQLIWMRQVFTAQSDRPSIAQGIRVFLMALLFTLTYGTLGFDWLDHHYSVNFNLPRALMQTLAMFFVDTSGGLQPTTRFGQFFANSIYIIGSVTLGYALLMLLRPVLLRSPASERERQRAMSLVTTYGQSSLARFALL
jgi:phosphatidylglycerol lysyltransferase